MSSRRRAIVTVLSLLFGLAFGGSASAIDSLGDAFQHALSHNPEILAARADAAAASSSKGLASTGRGARVFADARFDIGSRSEFSNVSGRPVGSAEIGLNLAQRLYDGGRTEASVRVSGSAAEAAQHRLHGIEGRVLFDTASAYLSLLAAIEKLAIRRQALKVLNSELEILLERLEAFEVTTTDVALLEASIAEGHALVDFAQERLEEERISFRLVVGADPSPKRLKPAGIPISSETSEAQAIARAETRNPLVLAALRDSSAAAARVDVARLENAPSVDLTGRVAYRQQSIASQTAPVAANAGFQVNVPLFDGGAGTFRQRIAREQLFAEQARVDQARAVARSRVSSAWQRRQLASATLSSAARRETAIREALDGTREEAFLGQRTSADVANSIRTLADAREALVSAQLLHAITSYEIALATGDLSPDAIARLAAANPVSFRAGTEIPEPPPPPPPIPLPPMRPIEDTMQSPDGEFALFRDSVTRLLRPSF